MRGGNIILESSSLKIKNLPKKIFKNPKNTNNKYNKSNIRIFPIWAEYCHKSLKSFAERGIFIIEVKLN